MNTKFNCDYEEIIGDVISTNTNDAIGYCVSKCLTMDKGIGLDFKNKFRRMDEFISQQKK